MPVTYSANALKFGSDIENSFIGIYKTVKFPDEIVQFNALISAFNGSMSGISTSSYHGAYSQVEFDPIAALTRQHPDQPRCELADVLFVSFTETELRITFLQAKSNKCLNPYPLWLANVEQYALLGIRPLIKNWVGAVVWNKDILKNATLPSVGSFGVFYPNPSGSVCFDYVSADLLQGISISPGQKYIKGTFKDHITSNIRNVGKLDEIVKCSNMVEFGAALYSMLIGTPIHIIPIKDLPSPGYGDYSLMARKALARLVSSEISRNEGNNVLLQELLDSPHFEGIRDLPINDFESGVRALVVVKGSSDSKINV